MGVGLPKSIITEQYSWKDWSFIQEREGEAKTSRQIQEALANLLIGETATAIRGDAGLSEGENQSKSLSFAKVDSAESCKESEDHQADEVSNWTHTKRTENETEKQKTREKTVTTMEETLKKEKGLREPEDTTDFEVIRQVILFVCHL